MDFLSRAVPAALLGLALLPAVGAATSTPASAASARPTCQGLRATIVGTPRNDKIRGTPRRDVIVGLGGNDTIKARGGDDVVCGGDGSDKLYGGPGRDRLYGQRGRIQDDRGGTMLWPNVLDGGPGRDLLDPGSDERTVSDETEAVAGVLDFHGAAAGLVIDLGTGGSGSKGTATVGNDRDKVVVRPRTGVRGTAFADTVTGSRYGDHLDGGPGLHTILGGAGDDQITTDEQDPSQDLGGLGPAYDDVVDAGPGDDAVDSASGTDTVHGGPGDDTLRSGSGAGSHLYGDDGDDTMTQVLGSVPGWILDGGTGSDQEQLQAPVSLQGAAFTVRTVEGTVSGAGDVVVGRIVGLERILLAQNLQWTYYGSDAVDDIVDGGFVYPLQAWTYGGDDMVRGTNVDDVIDAGDGTDTVYGGGGTDTCLNAENVSYCERLTP